MKTLSNSKGIITIIGIFILVMFGYNLFLGQEVPIGLESSSGIGGDLLTLKNKLEQVTLERDIFTDRLFLSLSDFSTVIPQQPIGRANPFGVIGR